MTRFSTSKSRFCGVVLLLPLLLINCGAFWQTDPAQAVELARTGEYSRAAAVLEPVIEKGGADPQMIESLYYSWIRQGEYPKARDRFQAWAAARPNVAPLRLAAARAHKAVGNYAAALTHLDAIQNAPNVGIAASYERAKLLEQTGKREEADGVYERIIQNFLNTPNTPARFLGYIAGAFHALNRTEEANDVFRTATKTDPRNAEVWIAWGDLFSEKFEEPEAIVNYRKALEIDPNMPEAHLSLAAHLAATDPEQSEEEFKRTLAVNPNMPEAHIFAGSQYIESERFEPAVESLNKALAVNPQSTEALSLIATVHFVEDNKAEFEKYKTQILQINPQYSTFYYTLAESSVSLRLYKQAVEFAREAVRLNPRDWAAMTLLGINLLRTGQEDEGAEVLERAFAGDPYNRWAGNTLTLLDDFKRGDFDRLTSEHFQIKLHKNESAALRPYVVDLLERAYKTLSEKYKFTPQGPLYFEMFPDHEDFVVRAIGLPGLGALGVCFGNLVVMDSPSARPPDHFNWGSTLWHEFAHVITLQMTDHKVPRWFSEGLSVYEERKAYPGWGDDMKLENLQAIKDKKLLPIAQLNDGFIRPKYGAQVLVSYYQASLVAEYIEGKWGFPAIHNMLMLYKAGKSTEEVFKEALKVSLEGFDAEFLKWVEASAAAIEPEAYRKLFVEGVTALEGKDLDKAIASLGAAVKMYPEYSDEDNAYEPLAEAYLQKGDKAAAIETLRKYMTYSELSFDSYVKLAELLQEGGDKAGAARALEGAMYVRPMDLQGHTKLGALLLDLKQYGAAAREYETLLALKTPDRATAFYLLAQAYLGDGKRAEARKAVLSALDIAPLYEPAQQLLIEISKVR